MVQSLQQRIESVIAVPEYRDMMFTIFARSMAYIGERKPEWCLIRFHGKQLWLFAGRLIVLSLEGDYVWLATDPSVDGLSQLRSWCWDTLADRPHSARGRPFEKYKRPASRNGFYTPRLDSSGDWGPIRKAHLSYLKCVLEKGTGPDPRTTSKHEPLVVDYMQSMIRKNTTVPIDAIRGGPRDVDRSDDDSSAFNPSEMTEASARDLVSVASRPGQATFRKRLLRAYGSRCAFSGCQVEQVLDAAHIVPYQGPETDHVQNGLLLRTDLHRLFDLGFLTVDSTSMTIVVGPTLANSEYAVLDGKPIRMPRELRQAPSAEALDLHRSQCDIPSPV